MSENKPETLWSNIAPYLLGGAIGAAFVTVFGSAAKEGVYNVQSEVNGYRARSAGGIVFETEGHTEAEKKCLAETEKFVGTLPENFIKPIKDYGVFVRVAEIDTNDPPNYHPYRRRVTLHYNRQTKSCDTSFSNAHELAHVFDEAKGTLSESKAYRAVVDEALESPEIKEIHSNPAARAELSAMTKGNPDKLIREETFADVMACHLVPNVSASNFLGFCYKPGAEKVRAYVASTLAP